MLAFFTTSLQRSCSFLMKAANSAGELPTAIALSAAKRSPTTFDLAAFAASACRRWTTASGVFAGAIRPYHCDVSNPL